MTIKVVIRKRGRSFLEWERTFALEAPAGYSIFLAILIMVSRDSLLCRRKLTPVSESVQASVLYSLDWSPGIVAEEEEVFSPLWLLSSSSESTVASQKLASVPFNETVSELPSGTATGSVEYSRTRLLSSLVQML